MRWENEQAKQANCNKDKIWQGVVFFILPAMGPASHNRNHKQTQATEKPVSLQEENISYIQLSLVKRKVMCEVKCCAISTRLLMSDGEILWCFHIDKDTKP